MIAGGATRHEVAVLRLRGDAVGAEQRGDDDRRKRHRADRHAPAGGLCLRLAGRPRPDAVGQGSGDGQGVPADGHAGREHRARQGAQRAGADPGVKQITYVSPDAAKSQLSEEEQKQIDVLGYNPLPPAFELKLTDANKFEDVSAAALKVDEVRACGNDPCVTNGADKTKRVLHWVRV